MGQQGLWAQQLWRRGTLPPPPKAGHCKKALTRGTSSPSSISSYKIGGGEGQEPGDRETTPPSLCVKEKAGSDPGAESRKLPIQTLPSHTQTCTPSCLPLSIESSVGGLGRGWPMVKPPPLLPSNWYEVDNLQGNNEWGPSQN